MDNAPSKNWIPDRKVWMGGLASVATYLVTLALEHWGGMDIPSEVVGALVISVGSSVSYLVPASVKDFLDRLDGAVREAVKSPAVENEVALGAANLVKQAVQTAQAVPPKS